MLYMSVGLIVLQPTRRQAGARERAPWGGAPVLAELERHFGAATARGGPLRAPDRYLRQKQNQFLHTYFTFFFSTYLFLLIKRPRSYTLRNLFGILLNQTEIILYLHFPIDLETNECPFGSKSIGKL